MSSQPRSVLYARLSQDPTGTGVKVEQQLDDCRALAEARGWRVVDEQKDNDISALKGAYRPGYERVLDLVRTGEVDHVVVWQTSRLLRNRKERAAAIELFSAHRVGIISVKGADLDLSTAYGRGMAGLLGEFDTMESEVKSERVTAAAAHRAAAGRPSAYLGYGWTTTGTGATATWEVNHEQAEIVREITRRLSSAESLNAVTADLNARGVPAPNVARWRDSSVKKLAIRPSNAAVRLHHRGRPDEQLLRAAAWPALVEYDDWERVTTLLTNPGRSPHGNAVRPGARKHLLTYGIGECGVCHSHLRVAMRGTKGARKPLYVCDEGNGCVGRNQEKVDAWVGVQLIMWATDAGSLDLWVDNGDEGRRAAERVEDLRSKLNDADDRFVDGAIDATQHARITSRLRPLIDAAEQERRRHLADTNVALLQELAGDKAERASEKWNDGWTSEQRRAALTAARALVTIKPTKRGPGFRGDDVEVLFGRAAEDERARRRAAVASV